ncbi:DUF4172 domain-containing protein [Pedobacter frigiditerrae]|uniref:DUF4172 domain-containing protein n=1 Tax=Pedobacter frigiditerrae TaxID=2530452 RepID=UPI00292CFB31|nr:DUF4172 domain-containing protein [Pedobacter frigiditerrae]
MLYNWQLPDWPNFKFKLEDLENKLYDFAEEVGLVSGLLRATDQNSHNEILIQTILIEALKTSEIEDEYLSRQDVMSSIKNNLQLNDKQEFVSDKKAVGIAKLMTDVRESYQDDLTKDKLYEWHSLLTFRQRRIVIGNWRQGEEPMQVVSGSVGKEEVHFEAPPSSQIPAEMDLFIEWFNDTAPNGKKEIRNAIVRSAIAHLYFESIHPFEDGNGRIGRAISQKALSQTLKRPLILSLSSVFEQERKEYYYALQQGSKSNEVTAWIKYFAETAIKAQKQIRELASFTIEKVKFFDRFKDKLNSRQEKALNKMFNAGKDGFIGGMTAKKYMSITGASKATATRDLKALNEMGAFPFLGEGRNINYQVMKDLYSVVIMPDENGLNKVKGWKDDLKTKIDWYNSSNSKAHITISEFLTDEDEIVDIINHLKEIAGYESPIHLNFEGVSSYPNGAVFLAPDKPTKETLTDLMKRIQKNLNIKKSYHSKDPHISIGRKLTEENVTIALEMFKEAKLEFDCTSIVLRKFNPVKKQYDVLPNEFKFIGLPPKPLAQQSLF